MSLGVSQVEMSKRTKIHVNSLSSLELGRTNPRQSTIQKYLEALGVGVREFVDNVERVARELGHGPAEGDDSLLVQLGRALRTIRLQSGYATVAQLAEAAGVQKWDLAAYEDGDPMNTLTLEAILKACNSDLTDLAAAVAEPVDIEAMRRDIELMKKAIERLGGTLVDDLEKK